MCNVQTISLLQQQQKYERVNLGCEKRQIYGSSCRKTPWYLSEWTRKTGDQAADYAVKSNTWRSQRLRSDVQSERPQGDKYRLVAYTDGHRWY